MGQEAQRDVGGQFSGRARKVLAAFDHQRTTAVGRRVTMVAIAHHARAGKLVLRHDQMHGGGAHGRSQRGVAVHLVVDPERLHRRAGRVDVQDEVSRIQNRPQLARAAQFGAVFGTVQHGRGPDAVQVVDQLAVFVRVVDVEGFIGFDVGEADRQRADLRPHAVVQQMGGGDHATDFVAVRDGVDQHVRAGYAGLKTMHIRNAGVALAVCR
ncbi:hypothetical protein D3C71_1492930 [compost metagenome]